MAVSTLVRPQPVSFAPPGDRTARLSHLDPRPLWRESAPVASAWRSPTFWLACVLVTPAAAGLRLAGSLITAR